MGSNAFHPGNSCLQIHEERPNAPTGTYWIDPDGAEIVAPFQVSCDMTSHGGGWLRLRLADSQQMVAAEWGRTNPWYKCGGDEAVYYDWIGENQVQPDSSPNGSHQYVATLDYFNLAEDQVFTGEQIAAIRGQITDLAPSTRIVATTSDDDSNNWQEDQQGGHEVYIETAEGDWFLLTPGTNGECGGSFGWGQGDSARYRWHTDAANSVPSGTTGINADAMGALPASALLPTRARFEIWTGGGASFGYERQNVLVR
tara:strand:- start:667 stop:1434 length:768 start_codon:yes stop_codon:yes gene_type:complete